MCGIVGFLRPPGANEPDLLATVRAMALPIRHRGPDDAAEWADAQAGIALGFRRLAIQDLSPAGRQPMHGADGRYTIVFNGEVFNFHALRDELKAAGATFKGGSDTEVMLAAIGRWGVEDATRKFIGQFAFGVWDAKEHRLTLARDQLGVKPLYWTVASGTLLFGSELKALRAHPGFDRPVSRNAAALFLRDGYLEAPLTIYERVYKLAAGTLVHFDHGADWSAARPQRYWSIRPIAEASPVVPASDAEATDRLEALLRDAVKLQMVADVPVGAFLSGGVDSSLVVALMRKVSTAPVKTYAIGFAEDAWNEATHAKAVARHLGTEHTEAILTATDALAIVPMLPAMYDEPLADVSAIPTYLVSKLARSQVTVSLSGDGGDELFGGYRKYAAVPSLRRRVGMLGPLRRPAASLVALAARLTSGPTRGRWLKAAKTVAAADDTSAYRAVMSAWDDPTQLVIGSKPAPTILDDPARRAAARSYPEWMMGCDLDSWLPDDILAKVDRASMAVSLESRVPLLDHRVAEFAWSLPQNFRIRNGSAKWLLRQVLHRHVPDHLVNRPKQGFAMPVGEWLRGPLKPWAESLLEWDALRKGGLMVPAAIRSAWSDHLAGKDRTQELWNVLTLAAWTEHH